jgi:hypothetical protein
MTRDTASHGDGDAHLTDVDRHPVPTYSKRWPGSATSAPVKPKRQSRKRPENPVQRLAREIVEAARQRTG